MKMMIKRLLILPLLIAFITTCVGSAAFAHQEMPVGQYVTLIDENNNVIHQTGTKVYQGDEYISADNFRYKVVEIVGNTARCIYQGKEQMPKIKSARQGYNPKRYNPRQNAWILEKNEVPAIGAKKPTVAIYHTHSDESYVPTDGTESINGNGGIYDVGKTLATSLTNKGFNVAYSDNNHNPHDINAYNRSRRTAVSLIKENPDTIIDVHRDAVPPDQYQAEVKGQDVTKIKLVVGRQNPNMKTNLEYAKKIKAAMDAKEPGLSNGIFMGKGDYNQDLSPRSMLIEVGSHTNSKEEAEKGVKLFADVLPAALGVSATEPAAKPATNDNQGAGNVVLGIIIILAAAAGGYYFINRGTTGK